MEKVKIKDIKTGAVKEVNKSLAGDYVGTGDFKIVDEKAMVEIEKPTFTRSNKEK